MSEVVYVSEVRIERIAGSFRLAYLPAEREPVKFGVHGIIAKHYGVDPDDLVAPRSTTIDYVIAATGG